MAFDQEGLAWLWDLAPEAGKSECRIAMSSRVLSYWMCRVFPSTVWMSNCGIQKNATTSRNKKYKHFKLHYYYPKVNSYLFDNEPFLGLGSIQDLIKFRHTLPWAPKSSSTACGSSTPFPAATGARVITCCRTCCVWTSNDTNYSNSMSVYHNIFPCSYSILWDGNL